MNHTNNTRQQDKQERKNLLTVTKRHPRVTEHKLLAFKCIILITLANQTEPA